MENKHLCYPDESPILNFQLLCHCSSQEFIISSIITVFEVPIDCVGNHKLNYRRSVEVRWFWELSQI